jgi:hypothetical protein
MNSGSTFTEMIELNVNANDGTYVSKALNVESSRYVSFQVVSVSGTHTTHVFKLQESADKTTWVDVSSGSLTGAGIKANLQVSTKYVRLAEATAQGGASVVNVYMQGK